MQTRFESFVEANLNTFVGFFLSWFVMHFVVTALWNLPLGGTDNFAIVFIFTMISIVRNYLIRRLFNKHFKVIVHYIVTAVK